MIRKMLQMRKYKQLSFEERVKIYRLWQSKSCVTQIAIALGRAKSTISRELRRNTASIYPYWPDMAQNFARKRRKRQGRLDRNLALQTFVRRHLCALKWSPEQIAGALKHRQTALKGVSHETIYAWIYKQSAEKLWQYLARHKAKRGLRKYRSARSSRIPERVSIHVRPEPQGFGHWEGDLMSFCKGSQHMLVTLEKQTRFVMARQLRNKTAKVTATAGFKLLKRLPPQARQTMTLDNGGEFTKHTNWRRNLGLKTYFCDPYCSWQKGAVENANGFLRRDLPRKTDLKALKKEDFDEIIFNYNAKPRKCLGWKTPFEAFTENLNLVALQT
jgi:IS30 family transposase